MAKKIESIKHKTDTRAHIPSKEEAGYEDASTAVHEGKQELVLPKNPIVHRGQDPELYWMNKYGNDDRDDLLRVDIRSLYRHEHIAPETLIKNLFKVSESKSDQMDLFSVNELFGNALEKDEIEKVSEYYHHQDGWTNRLIQGDSHLVMASLLEREGMAGQVQCIYIDPPYGIKYGSNWQIKLNDRNMPDSQPDESISGEPEMIKAYRDTWELGIHSYLSYLRDRFVIAKELLAENGSCFVQISDENVHLVRSVMDEVFGSKNFVKLITFHTSGNSSSDLRRISDYILWYAKDNENKKFRMIYQEKNPIDDEAFQYVEECDGTIRRLTLEEKITPKLLPKGSKIFASLPLHSSGAGYNEPYLYKGKKYSIPSTRHWSTSIDGLKRLEKLNRFIEGDSALRYKNYLDDFPLKQLTTTWSDTSPEFSKDYVVQTSTDVIKRCILLTTDPGDLVLDPTCGSGTTAFVAEQWGRRWITIDTSRIALNIAKQRLMTAIFPYYKLYDEKEGNIRQGFKYNSVPRITLKGLANNEPTIIEELYDKPDPDKSKLRVSGPFTVETLQNFEPISPEELDAPLNGDEDDISNFYEVIKEHLISAGVKNGRKDEMVIFRSVELLSHTYLHAEGFYMNGVGEKKAYFYIGPKFGTVSKNAVNEAIKECRIRGDGQWLIILGFSFESDIEGSTQTTSMGKFEVTKCRIHDDLLQEGLKKKPAKSAASFVTIGEPDLKILRDKSKPNIVQIEIIGLDIYDPIKDEVKPRNVEDIAYWMVDDDYDGSNFVVKQVFFCGGDRDEFDKWKKGLDNLAKEGTKKKVEKTLKIEIDDEAFDRLYRHISHPISVKNSGQKIAVRMISQFGEECTKVLTV